MTCGEDLFDMLLKRLLTAEKSGGGVCAATGWLTCGYVCLGVIIVGVYTTQKNPLTVRKRKRRAERGSHAIDRSDKKKAGDRRRKGKGRAG